MTAINNQSLEDQNQEDNQNQEQNQETDTTESTGIKSLREAHNRQKEENKKLQEQLKKFEAEKAEKENKELEEQGKYKELLSKKDARIAELEGEMTRTQRIGSVELELRKAGANDDLIGYLSDDILKTHDWDSSEVTVAMTIAEIKEKRPSAFTVAKSGTMGVGKTSKTTSDKEALLRSNSDEDLKKLLEMNKE